MHSVARGIDNLVYELITVDKTGEDGFFHTRPDESKVISSYPFLITKQNLVAIGKVMAKSAWNILTSFEGSFQDLVNKTSGTHAVDWLDFLFCIVPTLIVPLIQSNAAKQAILSLVKDCSLAMQWEITEESNVR